MYIEYVTPQQVADPNYTEYNSKGGEFRPTWLIRTSDWQKVPGTDAVDGYHALSYCWEQSGETKKLENGEYVCVDNGYHEITDLNLRAVCDSYGLYELNKLCPSRQISLLIKNCLSSEVTYDKLLQQICKDFDIEYLWYDKICINQAKKAEKHREIKQMHLIYSNACYTVALVPEIYIEDPEDFDRMNWLLETTEAKYKAIDQMVESLWFQRSWTLEEVMMSTRILVIGQSTHLWSLADIKQGEKRKENDLLANMMLGFKERTAKSANQVLRYAHFRTSTKEHDKIFALANIFADIISIDVDYDSDVFVAMNAFYRRLAQRDLSLMCFGSNLYTSKVPRYTATMGSYNLPSWTGVSGLHSSRLVADITLDQNYDYMIDEDMVLLIRCRYHTVQARKYNNFDVFNDDERTKKANSNYYKVISSIDDFGNESEALDWSQWTMYITSGWFSTHYYKPDNHTQFLSPVLSLSLAEECDECVILGVVFDSVIPTTVDNAFAGYGHIYFSPVARRSTDGSYKIIGTMILKYFQYNEPHISPQKVMDKMFNDIECETHEFCIK